MRLKKYYRELGNNIFSIVEWIPTYLVVMLAVFLLSFLTIWFNDDLTIRSWKDLFSKPILKELFTNAESIAIVSAVILYFKEAPDRRTQKHYEAWQVIDSAAAAQVPTSYARIKALADLNEDGISLKGLDAPKADLSGINLPNANLTSADLKYANLNGANLSGSDLRDADLSFAKLIGADLSNAVLRNANLKGADLHKADLRKANLSYADLRGATISYVTNIDSKWKLVHELVNKGGEGKELRDADLSYADLRKAKLSKADLSGADLSGAKLSEANLYRANLFNTSLSEANLFNTSLSEASLSSADLSFANLYRASLSGAKIIGAKIIGANLSKADLSEANLSKADLSSADLSGAFLLSTNLRKTINLTQAQLEGKEQPFICNSLLPENIKIDLNRDCDKIAVALLEKYPQIFSSPKKAQKFVDERRKKKWD